MTHRAAGDAEATFRRYVLPEVEKLGRASRRIAGNPTDAEDLMQDTLLRAFRSINTFDGRYPRAWLLRIMHNAQLNRVRRKRPGLLQDPDAPVCADANSIDLKTPEAVYIDQQFEAAIERSFAATKPQFCVAIRLVDIDGLTYDEAASALDVPVGTIMSRVHRGRKSMRDLLTTDPDFTQTRNEAVAAA